MDKLAAKIARLRKALEETKTHARNGKQVIQDEFKNADREGTEQYLSFSSIEQAARDALVKIEEMEK
jgi:hypothetical protein